MKRPVRPLYALAAITLNGTKTQTRRLMKPQPANGCRWEMNGNGDKALHLADDPAQPGGVSFVPWHPRKGDHRMACPYGAPGDRLWVRETWRSWGSTCDETSPEDDHECSPHCRQTYVAYAATPRVGYRPIPDRADITYLDESTPIERNPRLLGPWKPSIHLPRAYSRITLDVTDVRVQRLREITEEDAKAEGIPTTTAEHTFVKCFRDPAERAAERIKRYAELWDAINGARSPWSSNPWVWAITFKRVRP